MMLIIFPLHRWWPFLLGLTICSFNTVSAASLTNGSALDGAISVPGEVDSFTFVASSNDSILINIGDLSGTALSPRLVLEDPLSNQVASDFGSGGAQISHQAVVSGTYTVFVDDASSGGTQTGAYRMHFLKSPGALTITAGDQGGALTNGAIHEGFVETSDLDGWQFNANVGDTFLFGIGDLDSTPMSPWIRVFAPDGNLVVSDFGSGAASVEHQVTLNGTYTVAISDASSGGTSTANYRLHYLLASQNFVVNAGDEGGATTNGSSHPGETEIGDIDAYVVPTAVNNSLVIHVGDLSNTSYSPRLRVYDPTGALVASSIATRAARIEHRAMQSGDYIVAISDGSSGGSQTGDYVMHLARISGTYTTPAGDEGGPLVNDGAQNGEIEIGDIDVWEFGAETGANISLELEDLGPSSGISPRIRLYDPNGLLVESDTGSTVASVFHTAQHNGKYTVVVSDGSSGGALIGDYQIRYSSDGDAPLNPAPVAIPFPQPSIILFSLLLLGLGALSVRTARSFRN